MLDESPIVTITSVQERDGQASAYVTLISENSDGSGKYEYTVDEETDTIFRTQDTADKTFQ